MAANITLQGIPFASTSTHADNKPIKRDRKKQSFFQKLTVSSLAGVAVGAALRRFTSNTVYRIGMCLIGLQLLAYRGYITIHWDAIEHDVIKTVDQNKNNRIDWQDIKLLTRRGLVFLARGLPDVAGFTGGVIFGFKYIG